jgi:hypothetical protein
MITRTYTPVHYSHAYYPANLFYSAPYDGNKYALLRDKYAAEGGDYMYMYLYVCKYPPTHTHKHTNTQTHTHTHMHVQVLHLQ